MSALHPVILKVAIDKPLWQLFDYQLPRGALQGVSDPTFVGRRVKVPFGKTTVVGMVVEIASSLSCPVEKIKAIEEWLDDEPILSPALIDLCHKASDYYHHPLGEVLFEALPILLRKGKEVLKKKTSVRDSSERAIVQGKSLTLNLNQQQQKALEAINASFDLFQCFLLQGVTGSGKTEVYLQAIEQIIARGQQAMVLIPEIALTPQTVSRFQERFPELITVWHSKLTPQERLNAWLDMKTGHAKILIGTRSAIFTPIQNLGIIIVDEEHDLSFKQQDGFRYSARNLAVWRGQIENIPVVLGSATPSFETLHNAWTQKYHELLLSERAGHAVHPKYFFIDIRSQPLKHGLSPPLIEAMKKHLEQGQQVLLFLNRRGYAPTLFCHRCGWIAECQHCDAKLTLHKNPEHLHCHHCDAVQSIPETCPKCQQKSLRELGVGTERLEMALHTLFPEIPIVRVDRDTTRKKYAIQSMIQQVSQGHPQILVGTQMLAKGHHFPQVTLVAIVNPDSGFLSPDFHAVEQMGQLILQVSGRAGRESQPGEVFIQTYYPEHPFWASLLQKGYASFARERLKERNESGWPPFSYLALLRAESKNAGLPPQFLLDLKRQMNLKKPSSVSLLGPISAVMQKRKGYFRYQLLIQSKHRKSLHEFLNLCIDCARQHELAKKVKWSLDIDPVQMD